jgi:predicted TIM-barrel fold metal-dependent hydrolase
MISDVHIHLGERPEINRTLTIEDLYDYIDTNSIHNAVVIDTNLPRLKKLTSSDFIYGFQWITERHTSIDLAIDENIIGCKFHGGFGNFPRPSVDVLEYLQDIKGILLMHTGRYKDGNIQSNSSYLHSLDIAKQYTNIKVIMAHMGGTDTNICLNALKDSMPVPNIYFDTSGITTPYIVEKAVEMVGSKRIMFGSDIPWCSFKAMFHTVNESRISAKDKNNIFHDSLEVILG